MSVLHVMERSPEAKPKSLRRTGVVPMALVEKGGKTTLIQAGVNDVKRALSHAHGAGMIEVEVEGHSAPVNVIVKSVDREIVSRALTHVTMQQVSRDDMMKIDVPVVAVGTPPLVAEGEAILVHQIDHIKVRGKVSDIPGQIEVDISNLGLHETVSAGQVALPSGVELLSSPDAQLFSVTVAKELELEAPEAEEVAEVPTVGETESAETE